MTIELLDRLYNDLYAFAVSPVNKKHLERAMDQFVLSDTKEDTIGFAEWFIFNYRTENDNKKIVDRFRPKDSDVEAFERLKQTQRNIYEVRIEREQMILKDIFTGEDFLVSSGVVSGELLVSARLAFCNDHYIAVGDLFTLDPAYKDQITKYILDQYNQFSNREGITSFIDFIDIYGHLIYKVMDIVLQVEEENAFEDELMLYQATYAFKCSYELLYDFIGHLPFDIEPDEDEEPILRLVEDRVIVAEIEVSKDVFYVLCNDENQLKRIMSAIEPLLNQDIIYLKTDTFALEDLL